MKSFSSKCNRCFTLTALVFVGFIYVSVIIYGYQAPWRRFLREPPSTYADLARTCKHLLAENDLLDMNNIPAEIDIIEWLEKEVKINPQNVHFSDRIRRYSPRSVVIAINRACIIGSAGKSGGFVLWVEFLPINNKWKVTMVVPETDIRPLLWEGDDSEL